MKAKEILKKTRVEISPETFSLISLPETDFRELLGNPDLSPQMTAPFMIFKDRFEVTMLLDENDFGRLNGHIPNAKIERGFRLLTFDTVLDFNVSGFLAEITRLLAEGDIPVVALSAFSRDHVLIKQEHLAGALKKLGEAVEELC